MPPEVEVNALRMVTIPAITKIEFAPFSSPEPSLFLAFFKFCDPTADQKIVDSGERGWLRPASSSSQNFENNTSFLGENNFKICRESFSFYGSYRPNRRTDV